MITKSSITHNFRNILFIFIKLFIRHPLNLAFLRFAAATFLAVLPLGAAFFTFSGSFLQEFGGFICIRTTVNIPEVHDALMADLMSALFCNPCSDLTSAVAIF